MCLLNMWFSPTPISCLLLSVMFPLCSSVFFHTTKGVISLPSSLMMLRDRYTGSLLWLPSLFQSQQNLSLQQLPNNSTGNNRMELTGLLC